MQSLRRTLLLTLALGLVFAAAPCAATAEDVQTVAPVSTPESGGTDLAGLRDRLFVLEHELHGLQAELMALRKQLARLETCAGE